MDTEKPKDRMSQLVDSVCAGYHSEYVWPVPQHGPVRELPNRFRDFFDARQQGRGIWKWRHYFDIYERHFSRFRDRDVHILEIGVYSGGSLEMWRDYFGPKARIYGVDIQPECKIYEADAIEILIGDQADRDFWHRFRQSVPRLDIVIDDGSHRPLHQITTMEELLPHLSPGGVYLCEDIHSELNPAASYIHGLAHKLNEMIDEFSDLKDNERTGGCVPTPFQQAVASICLYPFVAVIERNSKPIAEFVAPRHGDLWQI